MIKKVKFHITIIASTLIMVVDILHRKLGGYTSGMSFSFPHTWAELTKFIPEFVGLFIISFIGMVIYQLLGQYEVICPDCEECFRTKDLNIAVCPKCGIMGEILKGFYNRHPKLKN